MLLPFPLEDEPIIDESISSALFQAVRDNCYNEARVLDCKEHDSFSAYYLFLNFQNTGISYILLEGDDGWYEPLQYESEESARAAFQKVRDAEWQDE